MNNFSFYIGLMYVGENGRVICLFYENFCESVTCKTFIQINNVGYNNYVFISMEDRISY